MTIAYGADVVSVLAVRREGRWWIAPIGTAPNGAGWVELRPDVVIRNGILTREADVAEEDR